MNTNDVLNKLIAEIEMLIGVHTSKRGQDEVAMNLDYLKEFAISLQQEQQDVELDKEIDEYFALWMQGASDEGCFNADSQLVSIYDCRRIARHFYELARQKYEK